MLNRTGKVSRAAGARAPSSKRLTVRDPVLRALGCVALVAMAASCHGSDSAPAGAGPAAHLEVVSGDAQHSEVGTELPAPLAVKVTDAKGRAVQGQLVNFVVTQGGGSVFAGSALSNSDGVAQDRWTLGTSTSSLQRLEVRAVDSHTGAPLVFATFSAVATPGPAVAIARISRDTVTGPAGEPSADSLVVQTVDRYGNAVPSVAVAYAMIGGAGSVSPANVSTDAQGLAKAAFTFGGRLDTVSVVRVSSGALTPVMIFAKSSLPSSARIVRVGGNGQSAAAGTRLSDSLVVGVTLAGGQPLQGALLQWVETSGNGTLSPESATTDERGEARAAWTLPTAAGIATIQAIAPGTGSVAFTATVLAGPMTSLIVSRGAPPTSSAGAPLADSLQVRATDGYGNPVPSASVSWAVTAGGGSISPTVSTTDVQGLSSAEWMLGATIDQVNTATASAGGLSVDFTVTGSTGPIAAITILGGDHQSAQAGTPLAMRLSVEARDASSNLVDPHLLTWTASGDGRVLTEFSGTTGYATWVLGTIAGDQTLTVSGDNAPPAIFHAMALNRPPFTMTMLKGSGQTGATRAVLLDSIVVRLTDRYGTVVLGAPVGWLVSRGDGQVSSPQGTTNAEGRAAVQWTLGAKPGANKVLVSARDAAVIVALATATGPVPPKAGLTNESGNTRSGAGPATLVARMGDQAGQPMAGVTVTWSGTGVVAPLTSITDANGLASTQWTITDPYSRNSVTASASGQAAVFLMWGTSSCELTTRPLDAGTTTMPLGLIEPAEFHAEAHDAWGNPMLDQLSSGSPSFYGGTSAVNRDGQESFTIKVDSAGVSESFFVRGLTSGTNTQMVTSGHLCLVIPGTPPGIHVYQQDMTYGF